MIDLSSGRQASRSGPQPITVQNNARKGNAALENRGSAPRLFDLKFSPDGGIPPHECGRSVSAALRWASAAALSKQGSTPQILQHQTCRGRGSGPARACGQHGRTCARVKADFSGMSGRRHRGGRQCFAICCCSAPPRRADPRGARHPARAFGSNLSRNLHEVAPAMNRLRMMSHFWGTWTTEPEVPPVGGLTHRRLPPPAAPASTRQSLAATKAEGLRATRSPVGAIHASVPALSAARKLHRDIHRNWRESRKIHCGYHGRHRHQPLHPTDRSWGRCDCGGAMLSLMADHGSSRLSRLLRF
jgi:hypothetical protein